MGDRRPSLRIVLSGRSHRPLRLGFDGPSAGRRGYGRAGYGFCRRSLQKTLRGIKLRTALAWTDARYDGIFNGGSAEGRCTMDSSLSGLTPVQQVALLGVRLRALDAFSQAPILGDRRAVHLAYAVGLDLGQPKLPRSVVLVHAVRAKTLDSAVRGFITDHSNAVVVDLGCGFDTRMARCDPPSTLDWFDVDFPELTVLRERLIPSRAHLVAADVTTTGWLGEIPNDRPTMIVTDGLMALLPGLAFVALTRALTAHFDMGELAFNAYSRLAMRNSRRVRGPLAIPSVGEGIDDPHEPESWDARLTLIEELSMARVPEVAQYPPVVRAIARISARSAWLVRAGDRVVRYRF